MKLRVIQYLKNKIKYAMREASRVLNYLVICLDYDSSSTGSSKIRQKHVHGWENFINLLRQDNSRGNRVFFGGARAGYVDKELHVSGRTPHQILPDLYTSRLPY